MSDRTPTDACNDPTMGPCPACAAAAARDGGVVTSGPLPQHRYPCPDCGAEAGERCRPYMGDRVHARRPVPEPHVNPVSATGCDELVTPPEAPPGGLSPQVAYNTMRIGIDALRLIKEAPTPYARLLMALAVAMASCDARTPGDGTLWRIKQGLCDAIEAYDRDIRA